MTCPRCGAASPVEPNDTVTFGRNWPAVWRASRDEAALWLRDRGLFLTVENGALQLSHIAPGDRPAICGPADDTAPPQAHRWDRLREMAQAVRSPDPRFAPGDRVQFGTDGVFVFQVTRVSFERRPAQPHGPAEWYYRLDIAERGLGAGGAFESQLEPAP